MLTPTATALLEWPRRGNGVSARCTTLLSWCLSTTTLRPAGLLARRGPPGLRWPMRTVSSTTARSCHAACPHQRLTRRLVAGRRRRPLPRRWPFTHGPGRRAAAFADPAHPALAEVHHAAGAAEGHGRSLPPAFGIVTPRDTAQLPTSRTRPPPSSKLPTTFAQPAGGRSAADADRADHRGVLDIMDCGGRRPTPSDRRQPSSPYRSPSTTRARCSTTCSPSLSLPRTRAELAPAERHKEFWRDRAGAMISSLCGSALGPQPRIAVTPDFCCEPKAASLRAFAVANHRLGRPSERWPTRIPLAELPRARGFIPLGPRRSGSHHSERRLVERLVGRLVPCGQRPYGS